MPQPNAKPLKYESIEDVKDTVDAFLKTEPSKASDKYKLSESSRQKYEEDHLNNVKNTNEVFSWDIYKRPAGYVAPTPKSSDFLSRLNDTVKTIDFNNIPPERTEEISPQVIIHKRARLSPDDSNQASASTSAFVNSFANPKRKKYKVVPNSTTANINSSNQSSQELSEHAVRISDLRELPTDRKELLKFVSGLHVHRAVCTLCVNISTKILTVRFTHTDQIYFESRAICCVSPNIHVVQQRS